MRKNERLIGAAAERKAVRGWIRRRIAKYGYAESSQLLEWLKGRDERYNKAKGGLGK